MKHLVLAAALASLAIGAAAEQADAGTPLVNARQRLQSHAIARGIVTGRLNYGESVRLANDQARIRALKHAAKADGVVTPAERIVLNSALTVERGRIFRLKHN